MKVILVVDDDATNLRTLGELLRPDYRVRLGGSGEDALRIARSEPRPDLILLDVMMPAMDGYEVLRRLQAPAPAGPNVATARLSRVAVRVRTRKSRSMRGGQLVARTLPICRQLWPSNRPSQPSACCHRL